MCRSSRHSELATSHLSTAFAERGDTGEQVRPYGSGAAGEDETSEGNSGNSNGEAVDVVPPVGMAEPGPRGPVVPSELRSAILQHGPCRLKGPLPISSENGNISIFSGKTLPSH